MVVQGVISREIKLLGEVSPPFDLELLLGLSFKCKVCCEVVVERSKKWWACWKILYSSKAGRITMISTLLLFGPLNGFMYVFIVSL